jgi:hypothetical protein
VRLVHRRGPPDDLSPEERTVATEIEIADSFVSRARGLMFRRSIPDDYALVFQFDTPDDQDLHMVFVPFPIDAVWLVGTEVTAVKRLRPWIGLGRGTADTIIELPAGAAEDIEPGDTIELVDE